MGISKIFFLAFSVLISGCIFNKTNHKSQITNHTIHEIGISSTRISMNSFYLSDNTNHVIYGIPFSAFEKITDTYATPIDIEFFIFKELENCFLSQKNLDYKVATLLSDKISAFLGDFNYRVFFVPKINMNITTVKFTDEDRPIDLYVITDIKNCSSENLKESFIEAIEIVLHEAFHLFVFNKKIQIGQVEEEKLAFKATFCNALYSRSFAGISFGTEIKEMANTISIKKHPAAHKSIQGFNLFESSVIDALDKSRQNSKLSEEQKLATFKDDVCEEVFNIFDD